MAYIITEPCIGTKDASCVDVCPVDCIYTRDEDPQYYIDPDTCIDCGACVPECPVEAILPAEDLPEEYAYTTELNALYFTDGPGYSALQM